MMKSKIVAPCVDQLSDRFHHLFLRQPEWTVSAPGRVNIIGEHLDYNDGFVLPMAIDRSVTIAASPHSTSHAIEFRSDSYPGEARVPIGEIPQPCAAGWQNYVYGVIAGFLERGIAIPPIQALITSNLPGGSGLSSSAALEVAIATLLETITDTQLDPWDKTLLCQSAEHRFAKMPCGIMDQFSSVFGKAGNLMLLDCRTREITYIPFASDDVTLLITNSNVKHSLVDGEYALRRQQCEAACRKLGLASLRDATMKDLEKNRFQLTDVEFRRARHVITEISRTQETAAAVVACDWDQVGKAFFASHQSLQSDFEVSCPELDILVDIASELEPEYGVYGSRMTGGGFGGSTITLVPTSQKHAVSEAIVERYLDRTGIQPTLFRCQPSAGARIIASAQPAR